jgi:hypothetical protein
VEYLLVEVHRAPRHVAGLTLGSHLQVVDEPEVGQPARAGATVLLRVERESSVPQDHLDAVVVVTHLDLRPGLAGHGLPGPRLHEQLLHHHLEATGATLDQTGGERRRSDCGTGNGDRSVPGEDDLDVGWPVVAHDVTPRPWTGTTDRPAADANRPPTPEGSTAGSR